MCEDNLAPSAKAKIQQLTAMTWNIENIRKNLFVLRDFLNSEESSLVFLSETQAYQCDLPGIAEYLDHDYCYSLNSDDLYDQELPLINSRAKGGTMVLWRKWLDPHIKVVSTSSSSFLPIILTLPDCHPSVHVALYLPTHGQDTEFVSELASLQSCLDSLTTLYNNPCIYVRGDANVNSKNTNRVNILKSFMEHFNLTRSEIPHKTYHHFVGAGRFDSDVDVILHTSAGSLPGMEQENVKNILCVKNNPNMGSHHDAIVSCFSLPQGDTRAASDKNVSAPKLVTKRRRINWTEEGVRDYALVVSGYLEKIRATWLQPNTQAAMSVLMQLTNSVMDMAAAATNTSTQLSTKIRTKKRTKLPRSITKAKNKLNKAHKKLKYRQDEEAMNDFKLCRKIYHQTVRNQNLLEDIERDTRLFDMIGENPAKVFSHIKSMKRLKRSATEKLTVGSKIYCGEHVADGFYDSMTALKKFDLSSVETEGKLANKMVDYELIMSLCKANQGLPRIELKKSTKLLHKIKKNVKDHYSITSQHYINAGEEGLLHYNMLINGIIEDINNAGCEELNRAHGLIFYKRHNKDRTCDRSYRCISTCPFLAKSIDMYIRDLYLNQWQDLQAETQYQGTGSSHELASLLMTEVLQYSLYSSSRPVYILALDAQSAFDRCLRQVLICELYKAGVSPAGILLIEKRLASRHTVYEWEGILMGPAEDITGFEQGGVNSSDFYKLYNNEQLKSAQESELGVEIGSGVVSAIGQADDVLLVSGSLHSLQLLVYLTEEYCSKFRVQLEPSKTKLLCYSTAKQKFLVDHAINTNTIRINSKPVQLSTEVEHVGVLRSVTGNLPHLLNRIAKHRSAIHALQPAGIARKHRGNPAAALKLAQIYATPVLLSGMASMVLKTAEIRMLDGHYLSTLRNLMKLHEKTPRSFIYLLSGSLPASAILHQKQMSLFLMICHLPGDPLHSHAEYALLHPDLCSKSWFTQIKDICLQYHLPPPLSLLASPPPKQEMKKTVKLKTVDYWKKLLTAEASALPSLRYFSPRNHSLLSPHPLWKASGSSPYETNKSIILARMASGRYRTERLCRFWSDNRQGHCLADTCHEVDGDLEHLLLHCPALQVARGNLLQMWLVRSQVVPSLYEVVRSIMAAPAQVMMAFILDCTTLPQIVSLSQEYGKEVLDTVLYMTRTYAYVLHRKKQIVIGKWPFKTKNSDFTNIVYSSDSVAGPPAVPTDHHLKKLPSAAPYCPGPPAEAAHQPSCQTSCTPCCPRQCQDNYTTSPDNNLYNASRPTSHTSQSNTSVVLLSRTENVYPCDELHHGLPGGVDGGGHAGGSGGLAAGGDSGATADRNLISI